MQLNTAANDEKAKRILAVINGYGGQATTTEIRAQTGFSNSDVHYRYKKLEEKGLIELSYAESGHGDRRPPRLASLTGQAQYEIEGGILNESNKNEYENDDEDYEERIKEIEKTLEKIQNRIDTLAAAGGFSNFDRSDLERGNESDYTNFKDRLKSLESDLEESREINKRNNKEVENLRKTQNKTIENLTDAFETVYDRIESLEKKTDNIESFLKS